MGPTLAVTGMGMVAGVGLDAPSACAAIRCAIDNFQETHFVDVAGERILGCEVPLAAPWRGASKLLRMAAAALVEAMRDNGSVVAAETPLLLCLAESDRPGRMVADDGAFLRALAHAAGLPAHHPQSQVIAAGKTSLALALLRARELLAAGAARVLIAATDSLLAAATLAHYERCDRLATSRNSNGFIPGEAAAAVVVEGVAKDAAANQGTGQLTCTGIGLGHEVAHVLAEQPLRADGLCQAIRAALVESDCAMHDMDFRIADLAGEQYYFKEASLAVLRLLRQRKPAFGIWHPADCVGEVGAAAALVMLCVVRMACAKGYDDGRRVLAQLGGDDGARAALVLHWRAPEG